MNFQQMTLPELESERTRLIGEINRIDAQTRQTGGETARSLQKEIQDIIERLTAALLPNLLQPTLDELERTFPLETQLNDVAPEPLIPRDYSLWGAVKRMFGAGGNAPSQNLERQRILLRNILWNLTTLPQNNGKFQYLFLLLFQKKQELAAAQQNSDQNDLNEDEIFRQRNEFAELLRECEDEIARRRQNTVEDDYHKRREQEIYDRQTNFEPVVFPEQNYSSGDSSVSETPSSNDDFGGFGGGGDFAGGGAGGGWDNYS